MKPIFRWTIGNTSNIGFECLKTSIRSMLKLYKDRFDYFICFNNVNVQILREIIGCKKIRLIKQTWNDCPLPLCEKENRYTSLWKFCPARLNINCHEIVCDNDIVIINKISKIDEFLNEKKILLVEDPLKCQGKFRNLFEDGEKYNAGFVGLPPGYDLVKAMYFIWDENCRPKIINNDDEQGLVTAALKKEEFIKISKEEMMLVHSNGSTLFFGYNKETNKNNFSFKPVNFFESDIFAYHFVGLNREIHNHWGLFKVDMKNKII